MAATRGKGSQLLCGIASGMWRGGAACGALLLVSAWLSDPCWEQVSEPARARVSVSQCTVRRLQLAADGRSIWATWLPEQIQNLDLQTGRVLIDVPGTRAIACRSMVHASGAYVVTSNWHDQFTQRPLTTAGEPHPIRTSVSEHAVLFALHPRNDNLAVASTGWLEIVPLNDSQTALVAVPTDCSTVALAWSPDGSQLAVVNQDGDLTLRDGATLHETRRVPSRLEGTYHVDWSADNRAVVAYGNGGPVVVWSIDDEPRHLECDVRHAAALSPDGTQLAICDAHGELWLVHVTDPDERISLGVLPSLATALLYSADGEHLVVGTQGGDLWCWSNSADHWLWTREPPQS